MTNQDRRGRITVPAARWPSLAGVRGCLAATVLLALLIVSPATNAVTGAPEVSAVAIQSDPYLIRFERTPSAEEMTRIGRMLFFDPSLSGSSKVACSSCHDPRFAFGPPNARAVQLAGMSGAAPGVRAVPSLRYRETMPAFTEHFHEGEDVKGDQGPTGGYTWDGRAATVHDQARLPLFSSYEMANPDVASLAARIRRSKPAAQIRAAFGPSTLDNDNRAIATVLLCLEVFQQDSKTFYPFTSKYDAFLRGKAELSEQETRGMNLFEDPHKGNCALCHPNRVQEGAFPIFTDNGYIALGAPRNRAIPANRDAKYFDLGLCGPYREDLRAKTEYCGMFRTPSLRNVAVRSTFFHNGFTHDLKSAVAFYASRDTHPERWYPRGKKFDDLPPAYVVNMNTEAPFGGHPKDLDALTPEEIDDIVAFLGTLTDADLPLQRRSYRESATPY